MWRVVWPLADSFTLHVYSWALDPGLWNKKSLCSSMNGIRHGLPKGPPWSLGMKSTNTSQKAQYECVCTQMTDKIPGYMHLYVLMYRFNEYTWRVDSQNKVTNNEHLHLLCKWHICVWGTSVFMYGNYFPAAENLF